ncbi:MAG: hypothetical protein ACKO1L_03395 [Brachymonas sp.]
MKKLLLIALTLIVAGCANIVKVEGEQMINSKMSVKLPQAWNKVNLPGSQQPYELWTQDGVFVDQLRFWAGINSGANLVLAPQKNSQGKAPRVPMFTAGMKLDQIASLFEQMYAIDGSAVTIDKVEPATFGSQQGVRVEFSVLVQGSNLQIKGIAWAAEHKGQLYATSYAAPRLSFFPRYLPQVQEIAKSAVIKG